MAEITMKVNGQLKAATLKTLEVLQAVITTQNPGSKSVSRAVELAGGKAYIELFAKNGKAGDVIEIYENEELTGRGTRAIVAEKMTVCLNAAKWMTEVFTAKAGPRTSKDKGEMEVI